MRVILAGSRSFGSAALRAILDDGHDVAAVLAERGDETAKRGLKEDLPLFTGMSPHAVSKLDVDLFVAAHSHRFIGRDSRAATKLGGIGYHPSLLPRHRGRDAVRWTTHMGDAVTGGSVYWLTDNVDGGPLAAQDHVHVNPKWDHHDLWRERLFPLGIALLCKVLHDLDNGVLIEVPQDEECATWEPSWDRPPLHRPELRQLGSVPGFEVRATADAL